MIDARMNLDRLIQESGEDYSAVSRLIGRNAAYIQQYIRRGTPRALAERDRIIIAQYFGIDETLLGAPETAGQRAANQVWISRLNVGAAAGAGVLADEESATGQHGFDKAWLRARGWKAEQLRLISVEGDSMEPALHHGDELLVEYCGAIQRDGIYIIRMDGALFVKRLARAPVNRISVRSDNPAYPSWENIPADSVEILGRVLWVGRTL